MDLSAVKQLAVEVFCRSTSSWVDAKITRVSETDGTVDVSFVDKDRLPAPQRG